MSVFTGAGSAMTTPMNADGSINFDALEKMTDGMTDYMQTEHPDDKSVFHFFVAAAHASDICETIRSKRRRG